MLIHKPRPWLVRIGRKIFYTSYNPLKKLYWKILKPSGEGVKSFIFKQDRLLLVQIGYDHKSWTLPGGAIDKGEKAVVAAAREVQEETGLNLQDLLYVTSGLRTGEKKRVTLHYFYGETEVEDITIDDQEIIDAGWFTLDSLPDKRRPLLDEEIQLYNDWKYGK